MEKPTLQNIQDAFLNTARRERSVVTIDLLHGERLSGRIRSFDKFSVLLENGSQDQLIFKHAISIISHSRRGSGELRGSRHPGAALLPEPHVDPNTPAGS